RQQPPSTERIHHPLIQALNSVVPAAQNIQESQYICETPQVLCRCITFRDSTQLDLVTGKPGNCPEEDPAPICDPIYTMYVSRCSNDYGCSENLKCCLVRCKMQCTNPIFY
ncbi:WAP four-disulfide core domain protein 15B-like, partial [Anomaloglossus baeobatrachus]|uniref:WAP four-disulfide core domain protein 15B-like n=1 Tax=Anomaloglossus baeobatrachus TaxID=238106 RepID=UPI003F50817A